MNCTIGGTNLKLFGRSIHSLARIGEDLYIETIPHGILFQTINLSRSAYARFAFESSYFVTYSKDTEVKCKVSVKSCLMAFRSLPALEKVAETCDIDTHSVGDTLLIKFFCKKALKKIYHVPFIENETVQAQFHNSDYLCKLTAKSRLLSDAIQNFSSNVEEVTLTVCVSKITIKNYVDDEPDPSKVVHTELSLESEEFEEYEVDQEIEVTFCLKELRAILSFSEGCNVPVTICCHGAGKPIILSIHDLCGLKSDFVLATLADTTSSQSSGILIEKNVVGKSTSHLRKDERGKQKDKYAFPSKSCKTSSTTISKFQGGESKSVELGHQVGTSTQRCLNPIMEDKEFDFPVENLSLNNEEGSDISDDGIIPLTPPQKKFRSAFLGLSQSSEYSMVPEHDEVLVAASDEDD